MVQFAPSGLSLYRVGTYPNRHASDPLSHRAAGLALLAVLEERLISHANLCGEKCGSRTLLFSRSSASSPRSIGLGSTHSRCLNCRSGLHNTSPRPCSARSCFGWIHGSHTRIRSSSLSKRLLSAGPSDFIAPTISTDARWMRAQSSDRSGIIASARISEATSR